MPSAWGTSWAKAWGKSWGGVVVEQVQVGGGGGQDDSDDENFHRSMLERNKHLYENDIVKTRATTELVDDGFVHQEERPQTHEIMAEQAVGAVKALPEEVIELAKIEARAKKAIEERLEEQKKLAIILAAYDEFF